MVVVNMSLMPMKIIGKKTYLQAKGFFELSKYHGPKRHPNISRKEESNETKESMKMEDGGVQCNRYNGCCIKQ